MKRIVSRSIALLLLLCCCMMLFACVNSSISSQPTTPRQPTPPNPVPTNPAPTTPLPTQPSQQKIWQKYYYVDEFNTPTDKAYISNQNDFVGTFSNSATKNSKLCARFLIDEDNLAVKLWEYGWSEVNAYSTTNYDITILDDNGNKHYTRGVMWENTERIFFVNNTDNILINLLQRNEKLKIYIQEDSEYGYSSTYLFEVVCGNFNSIYSTL